MPRRRKRADPPDGQSTQRGISPADLNYLSMPSLMFSGGRAIKSTLESSVGDCMLESGAYVSYIAERMDPSSKQDPQATADKTAVPGEEVEDADENTLTDKSDAAYIRAYLKRIEAGETIRKRPTEKEDANSPQETKNTVDNNSSNNNNNNNDRRGKGNATSALPTLSKQSQQPEKSITTLTAAPLLCFGKASNSGDGPVAETTEGKGDDTHEPIPKEASIRASDSDSIDGPHQSECRIGGEGFYMLSPSRGNRRLQSPRRPKARKRTTGKNDRQARHKFNNTRQNLPQSPYRIHRGEMEQMADVESPVAIVPGRKSLTQSPAQQDTRPDEKPALLKSLRKKSIMDIQAVTTEEESLLRLDQRDSTHPRRNFSPLQNRQPASPLAEPVEENDDSLESDFSKDAKNSNDSKIVEEPSGRKGTRRPTNSDEEPLQRGYHNLPTPLATNVKSETDLRITRSNEIPESDAVNEQFSQEFFSMNSDSRSKSSRKSQRTAVRVENIMSFVDSSSPRHEKSNELHLHSDTVADDDENQSSRPRNRKFPPFFVPFNPNGHEALGNIDPAHVRPDCPKNYPAFFVPLDEGVEVQPNTSADVTTLVHSEGREKIFHGETSRPYSPSVSVLVKKHELLESIRARTVVADRTIALAQDYATPLDESNIQLETAETNFATCNSAVSSLPSQKSLSDESTRELTHSDLATCDSVPSSIPTVSSQNLSEKQLNPGLRSSEGSILQRYSEMGDNKDSLFESPQERNAQSDNLSSKSEKMVLHRENFGRKSQMDRAISPLTFERGSTEKGSKSDLETIDEPPEIIEIIQADEFDATEKRSSQWDNPMPSHRNAALQRHGGRTGVTSIFDLIDGGKMRSSSDLSYLRSSLRSNAVAMFAHAQDGGRSLRDLERTLKSAFNESGVVLFQPTINLYESGKILQGLEPEGIGALTGSSSDGPEIVNLTETEECHTFDAKRQQTPDTPSSTKSKETQQKVKTCASPKEKKKMEPEAICAKDYMKTKKTISPTPGTSRGKSSLVSTRQTEVVTVHSASSKDDGDLVQKKGSHDIKSQTRTHSLPISPVPTASPPKRNVTARPQQDIIDCTGTLDDLPKKNLKISSSQPALRKKTKTSHRKQAFKMSDSLITAPESDDSGFLPDDHIDSLDSGVDQMANTNTNIGHSLRAISTREMLRRACPPETEDFCTKAGRNVSEIVHQTIAKGSSLLGEMRSHRKVVVRDDDDGMKVELRDLERSEQLLRRELDLVHQQAELRRRRLRGNDDDGHLLPPVDIFTDCLWSPTRRQHQTSLSIGRDLVASSFSMSHKSTDDEWTDNYFSPLEEDSTMTNTSPRKGRKKYLAKGQRGTGSPSNDEHEVIFVEDSFMSTDSFSFGDVTRRYVHKNAVCQNELGNESRPIEIISMLSADLSQSPSNETKKGNLGDPGMPISIESLDFGSFDRIPTPISGGKVQSVTKVTNNGGENPSTKTSLALDQKTRNSTIKSEMVERADTLESVEVVLEKPIPFKQDACSTNVSVQSQDSIYTTPERSENDRTKGAADMVIDNERSRPIVTFRLPGSDGGSLSSIGRKSPKVIDLGDFDESILDSQSTSSASREGNQASLGSLTHDTSGKRSQSSELVDLTEASESELELCNPIRIASKDTSFSRWSTSSSSSWESSRRGRASGVRAPVAISSSDNHVVLNDEHTLDTLDSDTCESLSSRVKKLIARAKANKAREAGHDTFESRSTLTFKIPESLSMTEEDETFSYLPEENKIPESRLQITAEPDIYQADGAQSQLVPARIMLSRPPRHDQGSLSSVTLPPPNTTGQGKRSDNIFQKQYREASPPVQSPNQSTIGTKSSKDGMMVHVLNVDDDSSLTLDFPENLGHTFNSGIRQKEETKAVKSPKSPSRIKRLIQTGKKFVSKKIATKSTPKQREVLYDHERLEQALDNAWSVEGQQTSSDVQKQSPPTTQKALVEDRLAAMRKRVQELRYIGRPPRYQSGPLNPFE